jgi:Zn-dependent metalloprotease
MKLSHIKSKFSSIIVIAFFCIVASNSSYSASDIKVVQARFEKANIVMDKKTAIPSRIVGLKYKPKKLAEIGVPITEKNVVRLFNAFLDENKVVLKVDSANLKLVSKVMRKGNWYVKYQQLYKGIPVIGATVGMIGSEQGEIKSYAASYDPNIRLDIAEKISEDKAIAIAKETYEKGLLAELKVRKIEKVIVPVEKNSKLEYYLAWRIDVVAKTDRVKNDKIFIVDAQNGKIIKQYPSRFYGSRAYGTVSGQIYPENPTDAVTTEPLAHERVRGDGFLWNGATNSNLSGFWEINTPWWASWFSNYEATFQLIGPYAQVQDDAGNNYVEDINCRVDRECNFTWTDADRDHINVFYHISLLHDWYRNHLNYNWVNSWDNSSRFNAEVNHTYNNAHAGDPMGFGTDDYARSSDVVYHECTHNVLHALYGDYVGFPNVNDESYAFDEGFADYFAGALTEDPRHGEGYGGTRTLDNNNEYTDKATYNIEGHTGGTIIAGAAWDIRELLRARLGNVQGASLIDNLIFDALIAMAAMPRDYYFSDPQESNFLSNLYLADDDNNNLMDGVPHFYDIQEGFANHNLLQAELTNRDSYDVSTNSVGTLTGGDFYFSNDAFWSNNAGQRGVQDLGDIGVVALEDVNIPRTGYTRQRVNAAVDHTYVALAQQGEEGSYIVFRVTDFDAVNDEVVVQYRYRSPLLINPIDICRRYPQLCRQIYPCKKYPFLCERDIVLPYREGLVIEFGHELDRVVVPVDKICQYVLDCPGCGPSGYCPGYNMSFEGMPQPFGISVYDSKGKLIVENLKNTTSKTVKFKADEQLDYYLVVTPTKQSKVDVKYQLSVKINAERTPRSIKQ